MSYHLIKVPLIKPISVLSVCLGVMCLSINWSVFGLSFVCHLAYLQTFSQPVFCLSVSLSLGFLLACLWSVCLQACLQPVCPSFCNIFLSAYFCLLCLVVCLLACLSVCNLACLYVCLSSVFVRLISCLFFCLLAFLLVCLAVCYCKKELGILFQSQACSYNFGSGSRNLLQIIKMKEYFLIYV